jgi:hypothetical protein
LRALALAILAKAAMPSNNGSPEGAILVPPHRGEAYVEGEILLERSLRSKCHELAALVLLANDPQETAADVLAYLPHHLARTFDLVRPAKRPPVAYRDSERGWGGFAEWLGEPE